MRRLSLMAAAVLVLGGCSNLKELFSAQADVAATARGQTLKADRVAEILASVRGTQSDLELASYVSNLWIDLTLFSQAVAAGELKVDSALVAQAMWPQITDQRITSWRDSMVVRRPPLDSEAVARAYSGDEVRLFQHILVTPKGTTAADTAAARRQAEQVLAKIKAGASFASQAAQLNEDNTRENGGYLPPSPRNSFVPSFENAGWELAPGEISGVVPSEFGFHLIRRPPLAEARDRLYEWVVRRESGRADSAYIETLAQAEGLEVRSGAGAAIKTALDDIYASQKSTKVLVDMKSGPLTVGTFAKWMTALQPTQVAQIKQQPDSNLAHMARLLANQLMLERQADSAKITLSPAVWSAMQLAVNAGTNQLINEIGLNAPEVADSTKSRDARSQAAAEKVDDYFTRLVKGEAQLRPLPGALSGFLRANAKYRLNQAGVTRSVELAIAKARADSAAGKTEPGVVQPAPGPAPVPGGEGK